MACTPFEVDFTKTQYSETAAATVQFLDATYSAIAETGSRTDTIVESGSRDDVYRETGV